MDAEILAVGTEILMGQITNTNARYISERLQDMGVNVYYHTVVGDNSGRLRNVLDIALQRSDLIIMTGGLGPTQDDLTKETVAGLLGKPLVLHEESLDRIIAIFRQSGWPMTDNNRRQAFFPEGCMVMKNNNGTAPGCIIEAEEKTLVMLPGPPSEMKPMFEESVVPFLEEKSAYIIVSTYLNIFGIGESALEDMLVDLINNQEQTTIATYAKDGEVAIRLTSKQAKDNIEDPNALVEQEIRKRLGDRIYGTGNTRLEEVVAMLLRDKNISMAIVDAYTGGHVSAKLSHLPEMAKVLKNAVMTDPVGSPSEDTASLMAADIRLKSRADIGLSLLVGTVEDGKSSGAEELLYLGLATENSVKVKKLLLTGNQNRKLNYSMLQALDLLRIHLEQNEQTN